MNEIILTDRWAKRSADMDRLSAAARKLFGMPELVTCVRCKRRTSNFKIYSWGSQCAEFFECSRVMDRAEVKP